MKVCKCEVLMMENLDFMMWSKLKKRRKEKVFICVSRKVFSKSNFLLLLTFLKSKVNGHPMNLVSMFEMCNT